MKFNKEMGYMKLWQWIKQWYGKKIGAELQAAAEGNVERRVYNALMDGIAGVGGWDPEAEGGPPFAYDAQFTKDISLDSLDVVEMTMRVEEELDIFVSDETLESLFARPRPPYATVGEVVNTLVEIYESTWG